MNKQRGGSFRVSGYIALALLALAIVEAGMIRHLFQHRQLVIDMRHAADMKIHGGHDPVDDDTYVTHAFPEKREVCSGFDTICWIRI